MPAFIIFPFLKRFMNRRSWLFFPQKPNKNDNHRYRCSTECQHHHLKSERIEKQPRCDQNRLKQNPVEHPPEGKESAVHIPLDLRLEERGRKRIKDTGSCSEYSKNND